MFALSTRLSFAVQETELRPVIKVLVPPRNRLLYRLKVKLLAESFFVQVQLDRSTRLLVQEIVLDPAGESLHPKVSPRNCEW